MNPDRSNRKAVTRIGAEDFSYLQQLMRKRAGIVLENGKEYLAETRLAALAIQERYETLGSLLESLYTERESGDLHRQVIEALAITETSFFRDLHPFEALKRSILPERVAGRRPDRCINIWSAACSSGQEPYSIAMIIRELFPQLLGGGVRVIASDISQRMLGRARAGRFTQIEVNRGLPAPLLVKYFSEIGHDWQVRDELRRMIEFREFNLAGGWPPLPPMDVILLRNVLLYLDVDVRRAVLRQVARVMRPDGYLLLGGGETTLTLDEAYEPVQFGKTVCYRLTESARARMKKAA
ncbi:MAG TPA: protein-glutamate O-methyltransferase CheR [Candidatus Udaeobacter sp.]|jgi:chemotaxis protein methyltransferase CheR|nr:protein-glutamate O-methyltransferase CheR [Candidatus Udaeobacter sp.]